MRKSRVVRNLTLGSMGILAALALGAGQPAQAAASPNGKSYGAYFRAWMDGSLIGVNSALNQPNIQTIADIPWGVDYVTVFGPSQNDTGVSGLQSAPFYEHLKEYAATLHARGTKIIKGQGYKASILPLAKKYNYSLDVDFDAIAKQFAHDIVFKYDLDGIDVDMEYTPDAQTVAFSNRFFAALGQYLGPKSMNPGTVMVYDTVDHFTKDPLKDVAQYFTYVGNQQYGQPSQLTTAELPGFNAAGMPSDRVMAGLSFTENGTKGWGDNTGGYMNSHIHEMAMAAATGDFMGMFTYAIDRDGRTGEGDDYTSTKSSTFRWTKASVLETKGYTLEQTKQAAYQHIQRVKDARSWTTDQVTELTAGVANAENIWDVISVFMSDDYATSLDPTFDPFYELQTPLTSTASLEQAITDAGQLEESRYTSDTWLTLALAVKQGAALLEAEDPAASDVAAATTAVAQGIAGLKAVANPGTDLAHLNTSLALAARVTEDIYTDTTWDAFEQAQATAMGIKAFPQADQHMIDDAAGNLARAIGQLVIDTFPTPANKAALSELLASLQPLTATDYLPQTWHAYDNALKAAKTIAANVDATQADVDADLTTLQAALDGLLPSTATPPTVTDGLARLVAQANTLNAADYAAASYAPVATALAAAHTVLTDQTATQAQVTAAGASLIQAIGQLSTPQMQAAKEAKARVAGAASALSGYMREQGKAVEAKRLAAEQTAAFQAGRQSGETGAAVPDLTARSANYQAAFAQGQKVGAGIRALKAFLAKTADQAAAIRAAKAHAQTILDSHKKGSTYGDYKKIEAAYAKGKADQKKATAIVAGKTPVSTPTPAAEPAATSRSKASAATGAKADHQLPQTGNRVAWGAGFLGALMTLGTAVGLRKRH
ncbi:EndoS/ChiA family endoglycosidase [Lacticaseibacillus daqingensis]|uniref:EndoS/ChiA family endoglycosidase n=1 Tax=Lacticaseibacillus daqingensis TaxID=2486014 RepID=UPI0013DD9E0F|nr:LPXTG cell wall anchor domain-containing protein [Lacticaseibacillus daqingensis]